MSMALTLLIVGDGVFGAKPMHCLKNILQESKMGSSEKEHERKLFVSSGDNKSQQPPQLDQSQQVAFSLCWELDSTSMF